MNEQALQLPRFPSGVAFPSFPSSGGLGPDDASSGAVMIEVNRFLAVSSGLDLTCGRPRLAASATWLTAPPFPAKASGNSAMVNDAQGRGVRPGELGEPRPT